MKQRLIALLTAIALAPAVASASPLQASELSAAAGLSVAIGSLIIVTSPVLIVGEVLRASTKGDKVKVQVTNEAGKADSIELPKAVADQAKLSPGDKLAVKQAKAGAVLSKNDQPIAFLVTPENAKLSRSHELAR